MSAVPLLVASILALALLPVRTAAEPLAPPDSSRSGTSAHLAPVVVSGYVELAYARTSGPRDEHVEGRGYQPRDAEFMLSAATVKLERKLPEQRAGTGFVLEAMAGDQASALRAAGLDLGPDADLVQAYGVLGFPRAGLTVSMGKMATMLGIEVIESPANPNRSVGYSYLVLENFTDLGVDVAWAGRAGWSARARVVNGWDVVVDPNRSRSMFAKLGWSGGSHMIALLGYAGSELPDSIGGQRSGLELLASTRLGPASATLQLDAGRESALHATWQAATLWCSVPLRAGLDLRLRAELLDDRGGSRTSGVLGFPTHSGQSLAAFTAGLDFSGLSGALLRPEIRYDRSSIAAFAGAPDQWTMALTATLLY